MQMIQIRLFLCCLLFGVAVNAQNTERVYILDTEEKLLGSIEEGAVYTGPDLQSFTIRGNTIYKGSGVGTSDILLLVDMKDPFSKKAGLIFENDGKTIRYVSRKGRFYLGDFPIDTENQCLLEYVKQSEDSWLAIHGVTGDTLGSIKGPVITPVTSVMATYLFIVAFDLDLAVIERMASIAVAGEYAAGGIMFPVMNPYGVQTWEWNGRILRNNNNPYSLEWEFDGRDITARGGGMEMAWTWENGILKPFWNNDPQLQWRWTDNTFQPFWDANPDKMWILEDGIMRPMWNADPALQWKIEGDLPLALIGLIAIGIIR